MKNFNGFLNICFLRVLTGLLLSSFQLTAQNSSSITGKVFDSNNNEPLPFATICLIEISDSMKQLVNGTVSDDNGNFTIDNIQNGIYNVQVTSIGYRKAIKTFEIFDSEYIDADTFALQYISTLIDETVIVADRIKGKSETNKSIYYISNKILSASGSSPDLLRYIPGVQVDLKQNISIDGNPNILLFVDGKERERSYVSQLNPSQIDRIEVLNSPPSNYDGDASGVINIILKKENSRGVNGNVFSEVPTSKSVVYLFPTYSLSYNCNKTKLFTSYNGEINYEDIDEITNRQIFNNNSEIDIYSVQHVRQKNLSHKFHYGLDYNLTDRDVINFYGFYNYYSYQQDGNVVLDATESFSSNWDVQKEESDKNQSIFNSLYFKHLFNTAGREITFDISNAYTRSENNVTFNNTTGSGSLINTNAGNPDQTASSMKIDFSTPFYENYKLNTGAKVKIQDMYDSKSDEFCYKEQVYALYGAINYKRPKVDFTLGLRVENAYTKPTMSHTNIFNSLLPYTAFHFKVNKQNDLYLSYRSSVKRPSVYLLNQFNYTYDSFSIRKGNPLLRTEMNKLVQLEHSVRYHSNFISSRLFYETINDAINNLTYLNDSNIFVTQVQNLGSIYQYGMQLSGSVKIGILGFNSSFRFYNRSTFGNSLAKQYGIGNKSNLIFESSISSILSFKNDLTLSVIFQYETLKENIQDNTYDDALYFISLDKKIKKNIKIGIVCALPFSKNFIYQGSEINDSDFSSSYTGNLKLPTIPLMFRFSYQFSTGRDKVDIKREKESVDTRPRQGF